MPRYGDLEHVEKFVSDMINRGEIGYAGVQILGELYAMPTADVVEVVRCKGCKWNSKLFKDVMFSRCLHPRSMTMIENQDGHFCGYGERRNDAAR